MLVVVKVSLMKLISSVLIVITIVISTSLVIIVVSSWLLLSIELLLIAGSLLLLERKVLLIVHDRRLSVLLLLLTLVMSGLLLSLSVSHAWVVEVVEGRVDVTHMATSLHHHGWLLLLLLVLCWPGGSIHHLILNFRQCLHARDSGRGECWSLLTWHVLTRWWHVARLLLRWGHELTWAWLTWGHLGQ